MYWARIHVTHLLSLLLQLTFSFRSCSSWHYPISSVRISLFPIAHGFDFAGTVALKRMATLTGATLAHLLASEVSTLVFYMPALRHCMQLSTFWNKGVRIADPGIL